MAADLAQRISVYTSQDYRMKESMLEFIEKSKFSTRKGWAKPRVDFYHKSMADFFKEYLDEGTFNKMPDNWANSEVFPVCNIGTVGNAGAGKSRSMIGIHSTQPSFASTGAVNKSTDAYTNDLMNCTQPNGRQYERNTNTFFKFLDLQYNNFRVKEKYRECLKNGLLWDSYTKYVNENRAAGNAEETVRMTRELTINVMTALRPWLKCVMDFRIRQFLTGGFKYRLWVEDPQSPYFQATEATFAWMTDVKRHIQTGKADTILGVDFHRGKSGLYKEYVDAGDLVRSQEGYRRMINMIYQPEFNTRVMPPIITQQVVMSEEDGRNIAPIKLVQVLDYVLCGMLYNFPAWHEGSCVYITSGSDKQALPIDATASPLSLMLCPLSISDTENVMIWRSKFFRRDLNKFNTVEARLHRVLCETLESDLDMTEETISSLSFREEFPSLIDDPGHHSNGTRFYFAHSDIGNYIDRMQEIGYADVELSDIAYVSSNLVTTSCEDIIPYGEKTKDSPYAVNTLGLAVLTEKEVKEDIKRAWQKKIKLYIESKNEMIKLAGRKMDAKFATKVEVKGGEEEPSNLLKMLEEKEKRRYKKRKSEEASGVAPKKMKMEEEQDDKQDENTRLEEILEFEGKNREIESEKRENFKEVISGRKIFGQNTAGKKKKQEILYTKMFIKLPANLVLTREEHMKHRIYAQSIEKELAKGKRFSEMAFSSSRSQDHVAPFVYRPKYDMATVYANPDIEQYQAGNTALFDKSIFDSVAGVQVHLAYERARHFSKDKPVADMGSGTSVIMKGVTGNVFEILRDPTFASNSIKTEFKYLILMGIVEKFRQWLMMKEQTYFNDEFDSLTKHVADSKNVPEKVKVFLEAYALLVKDLLERYRKALEYFYVSPAEKAKVGAENMRDIKKMAPLCAQVMKWVNIIIADYPQYTSTELEIYCTSHPLYQMFDRDVERGVAMKLFMGMPVTLIGNHKHDLIRDIIAKEEKHRPILENGYYNPGDYGAERFMDQKKRMKGEGLMMKWGVASWYPEFYHKSSAVVKINDRMIGVTEPKQGGGISWTALFGKKFAHMLPRYAPDGSVSDEDCFHQIYSLPQGEGVFFPRPFKAGGGGRTSGIIAKTGKGEILHYAKEPKVRADGSLMTEGEFVAKNIAEKKAKKIEAGAVVAFPCPLCTDNASTIHYAQGSTFKNKILMDLGSMVGKNKALARTALGIETTTAAVLVGLTRSSDAENASIGSVDNAAKILIREQDSDESSTARQYRRKIGKSCVRHEFFR